MGTLLYSLAGGVEDLTIGQEDEELAILKGLADWDNGSFKVFHRILQAYDDGEVFPLVRSPI